MFANRYISIGCDLWDGCLCMCCFWLMNFWILIIYYIIIYQTNPSNPALNAYWTPNATATVQGPYRGTTASAAGAKFGGLFTGFKSNPQTYIPTGGRQIVVSERLQRMMLPAQPRPLTPRKVHVQDCPSCKTYTTCPQLNSDQSRSVLWLRFICLFSCSVC